MVLGFWFAWNGNRAPGQKGRENTPGLGERLRRQVGPVAITVGLGGAVLGGYVRTGAFYDLVRADSLLLFLETLALGLLMSSCRDGRRAGLWFAPKAIWAGVAIVAAFYTKQTAAIFGLGLGVLTLVVNPRRGLLYGATAAFGLLTVGGWLQWRSDGWFWTYVYELHQSHPFFADQAYILAPRALLGFAAGVYVALGLVVYLYQRLGYWARRDVLALGIAPLGLVCATLPFGTQWAFDNAFIPGVFFPVVSLAYFLICVWRAGPTKPHAGPAGLINGARVPVFTKRRRAPRTPRLAPRQRREFAARTPIGEQTMGRWLLAVALVGIVFTNLRPWMRVPRRRLSGWAQTKAWLMSPWKAYRPTRAHRATAVSLLGRIADMQGPVFMPSHPYYPVLVGKPAFVHRMGIMDVAAALGDVPGLESSFAAQNFSTLSGLGSTTRRMESLVATLSTNRKPAPAGGRPADIQWA